jgi:preprotein translocase subunit SecD
MITGDYLLDARVNTGGKMDLGGAVVDFRWNMEGARRFAKITGENIGKNLAIVLEDKVKSAPVIRSIVRRAESMVRNQ